MLVQAVDADALRLVRAARARASRNASWPLLPIPTQSRAHSTIGLPSPRSTMPRALRGSTISFAGCTRPSHSGVPRGGVMSASKVAMRSGASAAPDGRAEAKKTGGQDQEANHGGALREAGKGVALVDIL